MAKALGAPVIPFMISGALLFWATILGTAHLTNVWAPQGKKMHIAVGRAAIFMITNSALALKSNQIISPAATNGIQVSIALALSALTYYATRNEATTHRRSS